MRALPFLTMLLAAAPVSARETLGQYGAWGAFRDGAHCFAIAETRGNAPRGHVAFSTSPARSVRLQFTARLSRQVAGARATARIGARSFPLVVEGDAARIADPRASLRLLYAARRETSLAIAVRAANGRRFTDRYVLAGAPSAIDAALVGCLG